MNEIIYALVENGIVTNVMVMYPPSAEEFEGVVPCGDLPVAIGDTYVDGKFYRDGKLLKSHLDVAIENMEDMQAALILLGVENDAEVSE